MLPFWIALEYVASASKYLLSDVINYARTMRDIHHKACGGSDKMSHF